MIAVSRRKLLRLAAPALILGAVPKLADAQQLLPLFRNPLDYPAGRRPGFDPQHPAAAGCSLSAIASATKLQNLSQFVFATTVLNLLTGINYATGGVGTYFPIIDGNLGPLFSWSGSGVHAAIPGAPTTAPTAVTMAAIIKVFSLTSSFFSILNNTDATSAGVLLMVQYESTGNLLNLNNWGGTSVNSNIVIQTAVPYFVALSAEYVAPHRVNFAARNLSTGQIFSQAQNPGSLTVGAGTFSGNFQVGNYQNLAGQGAASAWMYSNVFQPLEVLETWAKSPWEFWYPRKLNVASELVGKGALGGCGTRLSLTGAGC